MKIKMEIKNIILKFTKIENWKNTGSCPATLVPTAAGSSSNFSYFIGRAYLIHG